jgi:hypothetical protein
MPHIHQRLLKVVKERAMLKIRWITGVTMALWGVVAVAQPEVERLAPGAEPVQVERTLVGVDQAVGPGEYWLGIQCFPVPSGLREKLKLPDNQGLLVAGVVPDSPAGKAGIVRQDVLLRAADKPLTAPSDLVQTIEAVKDGKLNIELLRDGQPKTVEVTPAKRPENARQQGFAALTPSDREALRQWLEGAMPGGEGDGQHPSLQFRRIHPGAIVPGDVLKAAPLPANMSVMITRQGDRPARIVVNRGNEKWELTEKEIDKLPADVRAHVERMLGYSSLGIVGGLPAMDFAPNMMGRGDSLMDLMDRRFDEMNRRMDRLMKEVEALGTGDDHQAAPAPPADQPQKK